MPSLSAARTHNATFKPAYFPVAIFLGGTSGIGHAMAAAFARYTNGNAHIILCGRNRTAAEAIIASFPKPTVTPDLDARPKHEFVQCDVTLMKNVRATTTELLSRLPKVNFLVMSPGFTAMVKRDETEEGIDKRLALYYYARWKFTCDLAPLLKAAKDKGEDAKVMSVLTAGKGGPIDTDDLGMGKSYPSASYAMKTASTYNDLMMEGFAAQHPEISFTHIHPGFIVRTPATKLKHWALQPVNYIFQAMLYPFSRSQDECAELMWYALLEGQEGACRRDDKGESVEGTSFYGAESKEVRKKLWEHTVEVVNGSA